MTYAQNWLLAVAMKQPYPSPLEAGATTDSIPTIPTDGDIPFRPFCKGLCYRVVTTPCKCPCSCKESNKTETGAAPLTLFVTTQEKHDTQVRAVWSSAGAAVGLFALAWLLLPRSA
jgi:hypothetical protein